MTINIFLLENSGAHSCFGYIFIILLMLLTFPMRIMHLILNKKCMQLVMVHLVAHFLLDKDKTIFNDEKWNKLSPLQIAYPKPCPVAVTT